MSMEAELKSLVKAGEVLADAEAVYLRADLDRKVILCQLMNDFSMSESGEKAPSEAKLDRLAHSDKKYINIVGLLEEAKRKLGLARTNYDVAKFTIESKMSFTRATEN